MTILENDKYKNLVFEDSFFIIYQQLLIIITTFKFTRHCERTILIILEHHFRIKKGFVFWRS